MSFRSKNLREILESKTAIQKEDFRASLQKILDENLNDQTQADCPKEQIEVNELKGNQAEGELQYELSINGEKIEISQELSDTLGAIKDLGYLPDDYLKPNSNGRYVDQLSNQNSEERKKIQTKQIKTFFMMNGIVPFNPIKNCFVNLVR